ncbi:MAG: sigma factor [Thermoguttaceae bacterium]|jgi:DNA-directed RNA polymerase specialized sigma24 family protein|nr:sigma factor [Thermoguttaceae bacterium]
MREGDVRAWQRLVDLYAPTIYHWCRQTGLGDADAGDVVQEVFKSVITSLEGFDRDRGGGSGALHGTAFRTTSDAKAAGRRPGEAPTPNGNCWKLLM